MWWAVYSCSLHIFSRVSKSLPHAETQNHLVPAAGKVSEAPSSVPCFGVHETHIRGPSYETRYKSSTCPRSQPIGGGGTSPVQ